MRWFWSARSSQSASLHAAVRAPLLSHSLTYTPSTEQRASASFSARATSASARRSNSSCVMTASPLGASSASACMNLYVDGTGLADARMSVTTSRATVGEVRVVEHRPVRPGHRLHQRPVAPRVGGRRGQCDGPRRRLLVRLRIRWPRSDVVAVAGRSPGRERAGHAGVRVAGGPGAGLATVSLGLAVEPATASS